MSLGTPEISFGLDRTRTWLSAVRGQQGDPMTRFKVILCLNTPNLLPQTQQTTTPKNGEFITKSCQFSVATYEGWDFNSGNYLFTTDTK